MHLKETGLQGCFVLEPKIFSDSRGYFFESFNQALFQSLCGANINFVQDNESFSRFGTIRGLHFQRGNSAQAKLVRVIKGAVLDVAVDLRPESLTFGQWHSERLTEENKKQLFIPRGFAHGFSVLSDIAIFSYKCDNYYNKGLEAGIRYDDTELAINWEIPSELSIVSDKDLMLPSFRSIKEIY